MDFDFHGTENLLNNIIEGHKRFFTKKRDENCKTEAHCPFYKLDNSFCRRRNQALQMDVSMKIAQRVFRVLFGESTKAFPNKIIFPVPYFTDSQIKSNLILMGQP